MSERTRRRYHYRHEQRQLWRHTPKAAGLFATHHQGLSMILYLHGFRSSPQSYKASLLAQAMTERGLADKWVCPQLPASPAAAISMATHLIEQAQSRGVD